MITYLGLIVGMVENANVQDLMNQFASFLKKRPHLHEIKYQHVYINGKIYCTVEDTHEDKERFLVLCKLWDGSTKIGIAQ